MGAPKDKPEEQVEETILEEEVKSGGLCQFGGFRGRNCPFTTHGDKAATRHRPQVPVGTN